MKTVDSESKPSDIDSLKLLEQLSIAVLHVVCLETDLKP